MKQASILFPTSVVMAITFVLLPVLGHSAEPSFQQVVGDARELDSGKPVYQEFHCGAANELASDVFYQSSDGILIAHKTLDYGSGRTTPSFAQQSALTDEKVSVSLDQNTLVMSMVGFDKDRTSEQYELSELDKTPIVIDAGFDVFIRDNWQSLTAGKTRAFQFPLVSRSTLIGLRVKQSVCQYDTNSDQCFTLEPSNWVFRMLASPIELGYDKYLMRLNRYRGLSNINDENGKGFIVDITYDYQQPGVACNFDKPLVAETS